jgi:23S rRNA pseudouridine2605 synthase
MESLPNLRGVRWLLVNTMQAGDSGLLLVTSDGALADALRRRAETTPTEYVARVLIPYLDFDLSSIPRLVQYDEETVEFESVEPAGGEGTNRWFAVKSQRAHRRAAVRALFESRGLKVSRVTQVKFADLELPRDLPRGRHRELTPAQLSALYSRAGLSNPNAPKPATDRRKPNSRRAVASDRRGGPRSSRPTGSPKSSR